MAFAITHPIKREIDSKFGFISQVLGFFPTMYKRWEKDQDEYFVQQAKKSAGGDKEIEESILSSFRSSYFGCCEGELPLFYNAMTVSIYAYYEGLIRLMAKENGIKEGKGAKDLIEKICTTKNIQIPLELNSQYEEIGSEMREIRNYICHNNGGTPSVNQKNILIALAKREPEIHFDGEILSITGDVFLKNVLKQEHEILSFLAEELNYKTLIHKS